MSEKQCCIVPTSVRESNERLSDSFFESNQKQCQFMSLEENIYEYEDNYYCLLHLPWKAKKEKKLNQDAIKQFQEHINNGKTNFNYVCLEGLNFSVTQSKKHYSFIGAWIWTFKLHDAFIDSLDISYCKIQGANKISNSEIPHVSLQHSEIGSHMEFENNKFQLLLVENNNFHFNKKNIRLDVDNYGVIIKEGSYGTIQLKNNEFNIPLKITKAKIDVFEAPDNTFFVCPIFFKADFNDISELTLPKFKDYDFTKIPSKSTVSVTCDFWKLIWEKTSLKKKTIPSNSSYDIWEDQYRKFREIYNIARMRKMYSEQSTYFTLMQRCQRRVKATPKILKIVSYLYGAISDYGQSILKPLIGILLIFISSALIFWGAGIKLTDAAYLSLIQIKPYSLLYEEEPKNLLSTLCEETSKEQSSFSPQIAQKKECNSLIQYKNGWLFVVWSIIASTIYIILLARLGLALRWNFRKA